MAYSETYSPIVTIFFSFKGAQSLRLVYAFNYSKSENQACYNVIKDIADDISFHSHGNCAFETYRD